MQYNMTSAFIIPLFQFKLQYKGRCNDSICFERMKSEIPTSTKGVLECMACRKCQIANTHLRTHVECIIICLII